jgi:hypothetical protein
VRAATGSFKVIGGSSLREVITFPCCEFACRLRGEGSWIRTWLVGTDWNEIAVAILS